jgi:hypothetical protein
MMLERDSDDAQPDVCLGWEVLDIALDDRSLRVALRSMLRKRYAEVLRWRRRRVFMYEES